MVIELTMTTAVVGLIVAAVPGVIGWLLIRAVKGVDVSIGALGKKVDALVKQDTATQVELAGLRARVVSLEIVVWGKKVEL